MVSLAQAKMPLYLLPVVPAAALGVAAALDALLPHGDAVPGGVTGAACLWMIVLHLMATVIGRNGHLNDTRYIASVIRSEGRGAAEPVYLYDTYLRGLPFYLRETVPLIDYDTPGGTRRAGVPESAVCPSSETRFLAALRGTTRVFVVLRRRDLGRLESSNGGPLHVLASSRRHSLVVNRPLPTGTPAVLLRPVGGLQ